MEGNTVEDLYVATLDERHDLLNDCVELLNSQWPRSKSARLRSLQQFNATGEPFPISLLLMNRTGKAEKLLGHSKVLPVPHNKGMCFVESVVIAKEFRGNGYGRVLMDHTEAFVKGKGVNVVHLTTHDQQGFYRKLGYEFCEPVVVYGGAVAPALQKLMQGMEPSRTNGSGKDDLNRTCDLNYYNEYSSSASMGNGSKASTAGPSPLSQPVPPPPPLPLASNTPAGTRAPSAGQIQFLSNSSTNGVKMHMRKVF